MPLHFKGLTSKSSWHMTGHFRDESSQAINWQPKKETKCHVHSEHERETEKLFRLTEAEQSTPELVRLLRQEMEWAPFLQPQSPHGATVQKEDRLE